jgi:hypothetical protein
MAAYRLGVAGPRSPQNSPQTAHGEAILTRVLARVSADAAADGEPASSPAPPAPASPHVHFQDDDVAARNAAAAPAAHAPAARLKSGVAGAASAALWASVLY